MAVTRSLEARGVAALGAALVVAGCAVGVPAALTHARARAAWEQMSARLLANDPHYDAARSDALYEEVLEALEGVQLGSRLGGPGLALLAVGLAGLRPRTRAKGREPALLRVLAATLADGALGAALLVTGAWLAAGSSSRALATALPALGAGIVLALLASTLARGATPGMRIARVSATHAAEPPRPLRALGAALLTLPAAALAAVCAPVLVPLALTGRRTGAFARAAHTALTGVDITRPRPRPRP